MFHRRLALFQAYVYRFGLDKTVSAESVLSEERAGRTQSKDIILGTYRRLLVDLSHAKCRDETCVIFLLFLGRRCIALTRKTAYLLLACSKTWGDCHTMTEVDCSQAAGRPRSQIPNSDFSDICDGRAVSRLLALLGGSSLAYLLATGVIELRSIIPHSRYISSDSQCSHD